VFGMDTYEIIAPSKDELIAATCIPGHYTARIEPLSSKQWLHEYGFYYCDTLIEPCCTVKRFSAHYDTAVSVNQDIALSHLLTICHGAFSHDRFHRDFNLPIEKADQRYDIWLSQLYHAGQVHGLLYQGELIGFIAVDKNKLILHAITESIRGRGLAKYLWTPVCRLLFDQGYDEIISSVSATNLAIVNLYASMGFHFRNPVDLYHRLTL